MVISSEIWMWLAIGGIVVLVTLLLFRQLVEKNKDVELQNVMSGKSKYEHLKLSQRVHNRLLQKNVFVQYEENVRLLLERTYEKSWTTESIFKWQLGWLIAAIVSFLFSALVLQVAIFILVIPALCLGAMMAPILILRSRYATRQEQFDENLPQFINHMCLGFDSGASITKAMMLAIQTLEDDIRQDFDQLLVDYQMHMDDASLPFDHLAQRMPTEECKRFCNVTSTGLKNGNEMRAIFQKEAEYMVEEYKTKLQESAKKKQNVADAISTLFIFLPIVVIMVAPMVIGGM